MAKVSTEDSKSFDQAVNYDPLYAEILAKKGIRFTQEEKEQFEQICQNSLERNASPLSNNLIADLITALQCLCAGADFSHIGDFLALQRLNSATIEIDQNMKAAGGKIAQVADLVSGQTEVLSDSQAGPEKLENGVYEQIRQTINLPWGSTSTLDHNNIGKQVAALKNSTQNQRQS